MVYSTSGHNLSQVNSVDTAAITALYVDSVAAYVARERLGDPHVTGPYFSSLKCAEVGPVLPSNQVVIGPDIATLDKNDSLRPGVPLKSTGGIETLPSDDARLLRQTANGREPDTDCLRTDGELARMCAIGFKQYHLYQRWVVLHDMSRSGQQGFTYAEFSKALARYGVKGCDTYNSRLLKRGHGFYWRLHGDMVYPVSYLELVKRAIQHAYDHGLHDLYLYGNHPGQRRDMYISVSGSGADFEGGVLSAWYGLHGCPTISRYTLSILLNRDARSIRRMERRACITITYNEAQTSDPAAVPLDKYGNLRGDVRFEKGVWTSRMPNTYQPRMTRQHHKRGQGRKAACWFKHWLEDIRLPGKPEAVSDTTHGKLNSVTRTYCETDKALKSSRKRGRKGVLHVATLRQHKGRVWDVDVYIQDIWN